MTTKKASPTWSDVKGKLADFDRAGLIGLVQELYAAGRGNQAFLDARFGLGDDVLKTYKATIDRCLWPDGLKNQDTSVARARKAISDYRKAVGRPEGLAELMVFYCERAAGFSNDVGLQDDDYFETISLPGAASMPDRDELAVLQAESARLIALLESRRQSGGRPARPSTSQAARSAHVFWPSVGCAALGG